MTAAAWVETVARRARQVPGVSQVVSLSGAAGPADEFGGEVEAVAGGGGVGAGEFAQQLVGDHAHGRAGGEGQQAHLRPVGGGELVEGFEGGFDGEGLAGAGRAVDDAGGRVRDEVGHDPGEGVSCPVG